jgi:hypothetical protein
MPDREKCEEIRASDQSILSAVEVIPQQPSSAEEQAQYLELRIRSQSSMVSWVIIYPYELA